MESLVPEMSEEDIVKSVQPMILEYFENNDCGEVLVSLQEILPNLGPRFEILVISYKFDQDCLESKSIFYETPRLFHSIFTVQI